jgi:hypothetical protein
MNFVLISLKNSKQYELSDLTHAFMIGATNSISDIAYRGYLVSRFIRLPFVMAGVLMMGCSVFSLQSEE